MDDGPAGGERIRRAARRRGNEDAVADEGREGVAVHGDGDVG